MQMREIVAKKPIISALKELRTSVTQLTLFNCFIDTLMVFLIATLVCVLIKLSIFYAVGLGVVYGILRTWRRLKSRQRLGFVEEKVPELTEQLTTSADNVDKEWPLVESLNKDVLKLMKKIKTSYFISFGRLTRELITLAIVSILIITASAFNIHFLDIKDVISDIGELTEGPKGPYDITEELEFLENESEDIYGNESVAELGSKELRLQLNPTLSDIDISKVRPPEEREFQSAFPEEIRAQASAGFEENIPKGYQRIVKSYFREIAKTK